LRRTLPPLLGRDSGGARRRHGGNPPASQSKKKQKITAKDIPDLYPVGSEILVQVTKGAIGNKGPPITTNVSLAGRFMVLMPRNDQFGISRKIEDPKERARLRKLMEQLQIPEGMGVILRTVSQGQRLRYLVRDLNILLEQWDQIEDNRDAMKAPACVFREPNIIERTVRDFLTDEVDEVIIDNEEVTERMKDMVGAISRRSRNRITFHSSQEPIFEIRDPAPDRRRLLPAGVVALRRLPGDR